MSIEKLFPSVWSERISGSSKEILEDILTEIATLASQSECRLSVESKVAPDELILRVAFPREFIEPSSNCFSLLWTECGSSRIDLPQALQGHPRFRTVIEQLQEQFQRLIELN